MKFKFIFLLLMSPLSSQAVTKAITPGQQPVKSLCEVEARLIETQASRISVNKRDRIVPVDTVFWKVALLATSSRENCPALGEINLRVRGALMDEISEDKKIIYPMSIKAPAAGENFKAQIEYAKGQDTVSGMKIDEWFIVEVIHGN